MQEYKHSNKVPIWGLVSLILVSVLGGTLIGSVSYAISRVYHLIILFPIGMGMIGMLVIQRVIKASKVRNPFVAGIFGVIMGLMIYGAYQYVEYSIFRNDIVQSIEEDYQVDRTSAAYGFNSIMKEETGTTGLAGFMILKARAGETLSGQIMIERAFVMDTFALTLKSGWALLYWLFETGIIVASTTWISYTTAQRPFSESAQDWYGQATMAGGVKKELEEQFFTWLQTNDFKSAGELIVPEEEASHPTLEVYTQHCPTTSTDMDSVLLTLKRTFLDPKEQVKRKLVLQGEVSQNQYLDLIYALQQKPCSEESEADV